MGMTCPTCFNPVKTPKKKLDPREKEFSLLQREQVRIEEALHTNLARQHHLRKAMRKKDPIS